MFADKIVSNRQMKPFFHFYLLILIGMSLVQSNAGELIETERGAVNATPKQLNELIFRFRACGWVFSPPIVSGDVVYVGASCAAPPNFYAIDKDSGDLLWGFRADRGVASSPTVLEDIVLGTSLGGEVFALAKDTGELLWSVELEEAITSRPLVIGDSVIVGSRRGTLVSIERQSGRELWRQTVKGVISREPILLNNHLIVYSGSLESSRITAHDLETGEKLWEMNFDYPIRGRMAVQNGETILLSNDERLVKFDVNHRSPEVVYEFKDFVYSISVIDDDLVLLGVETDLVLFDLERREKVWTFSTEGRVGEPTINEGIVYFGSMDHHLYAVNLETGEELGRFRAGHGIPSRPYVSDGIVYFGSYDLHLYAVGDSDTQNQAERNRSDPPVVEQAPEAQ